MKPKILNIKIKNIYGILSDLLNFSVKTNLSKLGIKKLGHLHSPLNLDFYCNKEDVNKLKDMEQNKATALFYIKKLNDNPLIFNDIDIVYNIAYGLIHREIDGIHVIGKIPCANPTIYEQANHYL